MSDFFAEGFAQEMGVKFTQQQQLFLKSKLMILDPQQKNTIQLSQALSLLRCSKLPNTTIKKILDNLKITGKSTLDYMEMKKILRGVALAQNKIEPSKINIEANIRTKLPQFYDDDSQDEQPPKAHPKVQPVKQPTKQPVKASPPPPPAKPAPVQQSFFDNEFEQDPFQPVKQPQKPPEDKKSAELAKSIKKFDEFWENQKTQGGVKISGEEVKRLYGNSQNKKQLSKIWKLCCNQYKHKGYLSKGQLYIFISLMRSKNAHQASSLSPEMKQIITKIDNSNSAKKKESDKKIDTSNAYDFDKSHTFDRPKSMEVSAEIKKPTGTTAHRGSMEAFQDFDAFANFSKEKVKTKENQTQQEFKQAEPPKRRQTEAAVSHPSPTFSNPAPEVKLPQQIHTLPKESLQAVHAATNRQFQQLANQLLPQLQQLSLQNKQATVMLDQTNQFLNSIDQAHIFFANRITEMKIAQDETNMRLNQTFIRMRDVIMKQNQMINSLVGDFQQEIETGNERVGVLENYATNIENQANQKVSRVNTMRIQGDQNKIVTISHQQQLPKRVSMGRSSHQPEPQQLPTQVGTVYNKKSMQSMKEMTESMAVKKQPPTPTAANNPTNGHNKANYQSNEPETGGMYRQKLMEQLREQQRLHPNPNMGESLATQMSETKKQVDNGYHWNIGNGVQLPNRTSQNNPAFKQTVSDQSDDQTDTKQKQKLAEQQAQLQQQQLQAQQRLIQQQQMFQQQQLLAQQQAAQQMAQQQQQQQAQQQQMSEQEKNLKMKQVQLIHMIHYIQPITPETYPEVARKIVAMSESVLDGTYAQLYKMYVKKVEQEQSKAQKQGQEANIVSMPNEDEFSSNNFKVTEQKAQGTSFF